MFEEYQVMVFGTELFVCMLQIPFIEFYNIDDCSTVL